MNAKNKKKNSVLHIVGCMTNKEYRKEVIEYLLFYGAHPEKKNKHKQTACEYMQYPDVKKMLHNKEAIKNTIVQSELFKKEFPKTVFYALKSREYTGSHRQLLTRSLCHGNQIK